MLTERGNITLTVTNCRSNKAYIFPFIIDKKKSNIKKTLCKKDDKYNYT